MPEQFTQGPSILQSDIVNNLTTDSSTKPLSAAQGKALKDAADTMNNNKVNREIDYFSNTTLEAIVNSLGQKYGSKYNTEFCAFDLTDGNSPGMYVAIKDSTYSAKTKLLHFAGLSNTSSGTNYTIDSVNALNSKFSDLGWYKLTDQTLLTNNYVAVNTYEGRKISDYDVLLFTFWIGSWICASEVVIRQVFVSNVTGAYYLTTSDNLTVEFDIKPKTDTSFDMKYISSYTGNLYIRVDALKISAD